MQIYFQFYILELSDRCFGKLSGYCDLFILNKVKFMQMNVCLHANRTVYLRFSLLFVNFCLL